MRRFLALLLTLALLSALGMTALAEAPTDTITIATLEEIDALTLGDAGCDTVLVGNDDGLLLSDSLAVDLSSAAANDENASVPDKLTLGVGESYSVKVSGAKKYSSSKAQVATVSSKGVIKGKKVGSATITIAMRSGSPLKIRVTVKKAPKSVKLNKSKLTLQAGKTYQLKATLPSKTASKLTWSSDKKSIAKVSASGLVTAVKAGTAVITVKTFNKKIATCTVTVKPATRKVGVAMPTDEFRRWKQDGKTMKSLLKKAGHVVDLKYAGNDPQTQIAQIEAMIDGGCDALIVAPVDPHALGGAMEKAAAAGIPVLSYDRLILDSDAVSYYVTFGSYQIGQLQGEYIRDALKLDSAKGPFNIEFTAGDPGDGNAKAFFQGAYDVLKPYIRSGKLKVLSGQTSISKVGTKYWDPKNARKRAEKLLSASYSDGTPLHAWLCSNDSTAQGVIAALEANYGGENWPIITGQDCDLQNVKYIIAGKQAMSVFKDTSLLTAQAVKMVGQILLGKAVDVNDTKTYDNGAGIVPAYLCTGTAVTVDNYRKLLIDSGIYTEEMLEG